MPDEKSQMDEKLIDTPIIQQDEPHTPEPKKGKSAEEHYEWLETQMGSLSAEQANLATKFSEMLELTTTPLKTQLAEMMTALKALTPPLLPNKKEAEDVLSEAPKRRKADQETKPKAAPKEHPEPIPQAPKAPSRPRLI